MKITARVTNEKGFSLIEALVTLVLLSAIIIMLYELLIGSLRASLFVESRNDLEVFAQRTVNAVQASVLQSRLLYTEDAAGLGPGYRQLFLDSGAGPLMADSRLPLVNDTGVLIPDDVSDTYVGNSLIVVRALEPVPVPYDHDNDGATAEINFLVDRYRLEYYYLVTRSDRSFNGTGSYLDVLKSQSDDFADYFQLSSLPAPQLADVAEDLWVLPNYEDGGGLSPEEARRLGVNGPIKTSWNPAEPVANAFWSFDDAGIFTLVATPTLRDPDDNRVVLTKSIIPELSAGRISGKMEYSVCANNDTPLANGRFGPWGIQDIVPLFGQVDNDFPAGFEFKIVGPTGSRSVWNRLVLCSQHLKELDSQESVLITSTREF